MEITYNILVDFGEGVFMSDTPTVDFEEVKSLDDLDVYDHADICAQLMNQFCNMKQKMGQLVQFGYYENGNIVDLTKQMNEILIKHKTLRSFF